MSPRLPLGDLEEAYADPVGYRTKLFGPPRGGGPTYFNALRDSIFRFHQPRVAAFEAESYLEERLQRFQDLSRRNETLDQLRWYVGEYTNSGWTMFRTRLNVQVSLPPRTPSDLRCSGQISRADLTPSGFAGWIFLSGEAGEWRQEIRMPLLQEALAQELQAATEDVIIGIYAFRDRYIDWKSYSATEIRAARSSLEDLLRRLNG